MFPSCRLSFDLSHLPRSTPRRVLCVAVLRLQFLPRGGPGRWGEFSLPAILFGGLIVPPDLGGGGEEGGSVGGRNERQKTIYFNMEEAEDTGRWGISMCNLWTKNVLGVHDIVKVVADKNDRQGFTVILLKSNVCPAAFAVHRLNSLLSVFVDERRVEASFLGKEFCKLRKLNKKWGKVLVLPLGKNWFIDTGLACFASLAPSVSNKYS
jgi:hypothetical protein